MGQNPNEEFKEIHYLDRKAARDLHRIMLEAMRSREGEILRFMGFLLPALAAFFAFGLFKAKKPLFPPEVLLTVTSIFVIVILFFGAWYGLALSYNYRYLVLVTYWLQKDLGLERYIPTKWEPEEFKWSCNKSWLEKLDYILFGFAPEIFRTQVGLFFVLILLVLIVFLFRCTTLVWVPASICLGLIFILSIFFYPWKYNKLVGDVREKHEKSQNRVS